MRATKMLLVLACGLVIACEGQSRVGRTSFSEGGAGGSCDSTCDAGAGGTSTGGLAGTSTGGVNAGGSNAGSANGGQAGSGGSAGVNVIGGPTPCTTPDGSSGILVDVFQLPEGPRPICEALNQPGNPDPDCPSDVMIECSIEDCYEARTLEGCCRPDGFCGLLETGYWGKNTPLGCISRDQWIEHGEEVLKRPVVPVRCD